ncbi:hypothetical protein [Paenibacillus harenae]|uniref:Membrane protein YeaQ/YmgE (Transglycosylase-associated protein family) n=1 Tax=Paenibacillus harenae TaxID=306543 RepID=A0ABT9U1N6_PAEHA|nr:hypothetical protein [Paenibacillus harenae]MDQ0113542.1 putative membrane protein YeaQ/YmgE (transglycosylase-associated protein family) [Paenibacillus harenae]
MKPLYTFVSILVSIFAASLLSALIISLLFFSLPAVFYVVFVCFIGTAVFGASISFLIHWLIKSERLHGFIFKLVLHIAAAAVLIMLLDGGNVNNIFVLIAAVINAIIYFIVYTCTRRYLFNER